MCSHDNHLASLLRDFCKYFNPSFRFIKLFDNPSITSKVFWVVSIFNVFVFNKTGLLPKIYDQVFLQYYAYFLFVLSVGKLLHLYRVCYSSLPCHPMFGLIFILNIRLVNVLFGIKFWLLFASLLPLIIALPESIFCEKKSAYI